MKRKQEQISRRITVLVDRLHALETKPVEPHQRPIIEVGILALRDKIRELGRLMRAV